jgi:hypothetical protein
VDSRPKKLTCAFAILCPLLNRCFVSKKDAHNSFITILMVEPGVDFEAEATRIQSIYRGQAPPFFLEGQDGVISDWIPMF